MKKNNGIFNNKSNNRYKKHLSKNDSDNDALDAFIKQMQADSDKRKDETLKEEGEKSEDLHENTARSKPDAKPTKLVFFRKLDTYQALLEVTPRQGLSVKDCFSKVVLYIIDWFRNRMGDEPFKRYPEIEFFRTDYPMPENYADFKIDNVHNIVGLSFIDLETTYVPNKAWLFCLDEPDNNQEGLNIIGRSFKTEISVYLKTKSVVLGIRISSREPEENTKDPQSMRPAIVKTLAKDPQLILCGQGLDTKYAFTDVPILLNGKSKEACEALFKGLINSRYRRMPILFVPGEFYERNTDAVNGLTQSMRGYGHVVVIENGCRKLFEKVMCNDVFVEANEEGRLIFYRSTIKQEYPTEFFEPDMEDVIGYIKSVAQRETIRKKFDFSRYPFKPNTKDLMSGKKGKKSDNTVLEENRRLKTEIKELKREAGDRINDYDLLNSANLELKSDNDRLKVSINKIHSENVQLKIDEEQNKSNISDLKSTNAELQSLLERQKEELNNRMEAERERTIALLKIPYFDKDKKDKILDWIRECYSDVLIVHKRAEKSLFADNRNIDWHRFCMMIHYLAGYTRYRNAGGVALNKEAAREYDPEGAFYTVEPTSTGQGATEFHRDEYTISVEKPDGTKENVILDLHMKIGKGRDVNMIRIYFYYSPELKKTIIGYMPGHLLLRD